LPVFSKSSEKKADIKKRISIKNSLKRNKIPDDMSWILK